MNIDLIDARGLSLNPPYGSLVAACGMGIDGKHIETRGYWPHSYRGHRWLLIHQTKGLGEMFDDEDDLRDLCRDEPFCTVLRAMNYQDSALLPRGKVVAAAWLADVITMSKANLSAIAWWARTANGRRRVWSLTDRERAFGLFEPGRKAILLSDIHALKQPIECRGMQGLWVPSAEVIRAVQGQVNHAST